MKVDHKTITGLNQGSCKFCRNTTKIIQMTGPKENTFRTKQKVMPWPTGEMMEGVGGDIRLVTKK